MGNIRIIIICLFSIFLSVSSCTNTVQNDKQAIFSKEVTLNADSTEISIIIKAGNIFRADPYIVVSDVAHADGMHFAVFNDSLKYLYSFCPYGSGPDECLMPTVIKNMPKNQFLVRDHGNSVYHSYILSDSQAVHDRTFRIRDFSPYESVWETNYVSNNTYLTKGVSPRRSVRRLVDFSSEIILDSLAPAFNLKEIMGSDYYSEFDDFWMVAHKDRFACAYYFINRIELGQVANDSLIIINYWGAGTPPEFHRYTDEKLTGKYEYNVDYNIVYYEWLYGSNNHVYASYFGLPWGDIKQHSHIIEVYKYTGDPMVKYNLDISLSSFIVLDDNKIIGINPDRSDDQFYSFTISQ